MSTRYLVGDVLDVLKSMPDASVDLVLSSPPFLALRSYLPSDHPDKAKEIGSEPTPGAFIDTLLDVVEECRRVLAPHGSLCFELGDTYAGSGGAGGDYAANGLRDGQERFDGSKSRAFGTGAAAHPARVGRPRPAGRDWGKSDTNPASRKDRDGWPLDKSLCLIPELLRIAMVYGINPLTGRQTPRWRARNVVRWCRPNPPVGALSDKVRPATSDIIVACVDRKRYFDLDAVRTPFTGHAYTEGSERRAGPPEQTLGRRQNGLDKRTETHHGAPPLDHWWFDEVEDLFPQDAWHVSTEPYKGSHYATWPPALLVKPILAMCPQRVCLTCGKPSERIVERLNAVGMGTVRSRQPGHERAHTSTGMPDAAEHATIGWTDCGHDHWRQGVVLDPFAGSGTTLLVAHGHGRSAVGIDLDARNAELARARVGMWLEVEVHRPTPVLQPLKGEECECIPCGIVFEDELAFDSHISGGRHVRPADSAGVA